MDTPKEQTLLLTILYTKDYNTPHKEVGQSPTSGMQCVHCARVASTAVMAGMAEIGGHDHAAFFLLRVYVPGRFCVRAE